MPSCKIRILSTIVMAFGFAFFAPQPVAADAWQWSSKDLVRQAGTSDASVFLPPSYTQEEERAYSKYTFQPLLNERNRNRVQTKAGDRYSPDEMLMSDDGQKIVAFSRNTPGLFVSTDAGETWIDRTYSLTSDSSSYLYNGAISPDGGTLYALWKDYVTVRGVVYDMSNRLVVSFDYGANWHPLPFPTSNGDQQLPLGKNCHRNGLIGIVAFSEEAKVVCQGKESLGQDGALYPLSRDGKVLLYIVSPFARDRSLPIDNGRQTFWMSLNGGNSWFQTNISSRLYKLEQPASSDDGNTIMLKGTNPAYTEEESMLHLSRNAGVSWRYHDFSGQITAMSTSGNGDTMYVAVKPEFNLGNRPNPPATVWKSVNGGDSWINEGISPPEKDETIRAISGDGNIIFAPILPTPGRPRYAFYAGRIFDNTPKLPASYDHGKTWTEISMPSEGAAGGSVFKISRDGKRALIHAGGSTIYVGTKDLTLTGSLTVAPTCTIPAGQTTCQPSFDWTTTNTYKGSAGSVTFNIVGSAPYTSEKTYASSPTASGTGGRGAPLAAGTYTIKLFGFSQAANTWVLLDSKPVVVNAQNTPLTGSLTVAPTCTIPAGQTTCQPSFDWMTTNTHQGSAGSVTFKIVGSAPYTSEKTYASSPTPSGAAGRGAPLAAGTYTIKLYGFSQSANTWVFLDKKNVVVSGQSAASVPTSAPTSNQPSPFAAPTANKLPTGYFDVANCTSVDGWAFDPNASSTPISVNIKEGSTGRILGTANAPRGDVNAIMGVDGNHGFSFPIPASLKDGLPHSLKAYAIDIQTGAETALGPAATKTITCGTSATAPASVISASVLTPLQRVMDSVFQIFR